MFIARSSWLMLGVLAVCCGGESKSRSSAGDGKATATGGTSSSSGGAPAGDAPAGDAPAGDAPAGDGQAGSACVCTIVFSGAGGKDGDCDPATLWRALGTAGGFLVCREASPHLDPTEKPGPGRGAVVLDADGRVIDNTGLEGAAKQAWLDDLAAQRWPCLAGETLGYSCSSRD